MGGYTERLAPIWCITTTCENPEGVFKYFIESMMDGGDMQTLWTYGVEGVHWSTKAETVCGNTYEEGEFHMLESLEKPGTQYTKATMDPTLSIVEWDTDPGQNAVSEVTRASQELFNANCVQDGHLQRRPDYLKALHRGGRCGAGSVSGGSLRQIRGGARR